MKDIEPLQHQSKIAQNPVLDNATYVVADLAKATGLPVGTIKMWIERRILQLDAFDKAGHGKGSTRQFTLRTVFVAATIAEATRMGFSPSKAAMWAHLVWRTPILEEGTVPRGKAVFIGNPTSDDWRICRRDLLSADVIFGEANSLKEASAVLIDVAAIARRCVGILGIRDASGEGHDGTA